MSAKFALVATLACVFGSVGRADPPAPRDDALRLAPPDAALVVVVQNLRGHLTDVSASPFAAWLPSSALGKQLLNGPGLKIFTDGAAPVLGTLGLTPTDLFHDIVGDAVVFAYTPPMPNDPKAERSVILLRPRKMNTLTAAVDRLNDLQKKNGELTGVTERKHAGGAYFERQKPDGASDFYCTRGGVFAFSQSEPEIRAVIERDKGAGDKPPSLSARLTKLGVAEAAAVVLVNPRPLDAEFTAKVAAARGDEKAFLTKFAEVWAATDAAALYLSLSKDAELGVALNFAPEKLPAGLKGWLVGGRTPSALWNTVPANALFAAAGRVKPNDLLDALAQLAPMTDKPGVRETLGETLGPVFGKDKWPLVLDALGPDWGVWVQPPAPGTAVPVAVAAVKVATVGPKGADAAKALDQALEYGFQVARVAYNAKNEEQLELKEETSAGTVIKSLSGGALPPGVVPSFALKDGYLLLATSPDAIKSFKTPTADTVPLGEVPFARFNAASVREYLAAHGPKLAKLLNSAGAGTEASLVEQLGQLGLALEPVERVELLTRGDDGGLKLLLRVKTVKPLKE
ncbi:hypothetical protein GobsT_27030 [Gemmata obscuriglobus]|uniref:DUF3352 domain-containing protein n=1 Tax=Gemmata obscuriglobus TaxID=114 RepID=A0A2Z3GZY7_9BACT|nr:hypothetical protein [Gemmata obscuriglobus]AWM39028.1 hypothetical protein C1280_19960 [Gemmata obscuriglobus]QEG27939.1 hypothetical protein GobsT_27030 [Gemmata obscuriglobus]VTS05404.1 Uncharacterized protein OS=Singulisphaera acidiphila (strain ATCC BAA-1392 / DSM 18658 / VKM B-2454 / MOB10) GN=Sinac_5524 PE=4 SV=1 [Gemmata obscuriglobus UQM 2246]